MGHFLYYKCDTGRGTPAAFSDGAQYAEKPNVLLFYCIRVTRL